MGSDEKIGLWVKAIAAKYPDLGNVYLAVDGLKLRLQRPGDDGVQNYIYNVIAISNCSFVMPVDDVRKL